MSLILYVRLCIRAHMCSCACALDLVRMFGMIFFNVSNILQNGTYYIYLPSPLYISNEKSM